MYLSTIPSVQAPNKQGENGITRPWLDMVRLLGGVDGYTEKLGDAAVVSPRERLLDERGHGFWEGG